MKLKPKNWNHFQHYKNRNPPWIKFHRDILNDRDFMSLPLASKALAPLLWLLASEEHDGVFDASIEELQFRLRLSTNEIEQGLKPLIDKGLFVIDSGVLAPCLQVASKSCSEREGEGEKENMSTVKTVDDLFDKFWNNYPRKEAKVSAEKAWRKLTKSKKEKAIQDSRHRFDSIDRKFIPLPATYINGERWEDEQQVQKHDPTEWAI